MLLGLFFPDVVFKTTSYVNESILLLFESLCQTLVSGPGIKYWKNYLSESGAEIPPLC